MLMNISYIDMCKLNKNREQRKEWKREREFGGDGVCGCSFGEHLNKKPFRPLYIFKVCVVVHLVNT